MTRFAAILAAADGSCRKWFGLSAAHTYFVVGAGMLAGAAMETFMINVWIKDTNFYSVVLKKEAEKQAEARALSETRDPEAPKQFAEILKEQWEARKKELEAAKQK